MTHNIPLLAGGLALMALVATGCAGGSQRDELSFEHPTLPDIPQYRVQLSDFGATGDGQTLCSEAFTQALAHLDSVGGGTLEVSAGEWLTGPLVLGSHVELHLAEGAVLRFCPDFALYASQDALWHNGVTRRQAPITAYRATDIAITGQGTIDGGGHAWRPKSRSLHSEEEWQAITANPEVGVTDPSGQRWYPIEAWQLNDRSEVSMDDPANGKARHAPWYQLKTRMRPENIWLYECERVLLQGVTFRNSPFWNVHPELCRELTIHDCTIYNEWNAVNGDGLDLESCSSVWVARCHFDVGDDAICLKSGMNAAGRLRGRPTEDVLVEDCTVLHAHGGFVVGSEMSGGVRNIHIRRCTFEGTESGLRFKTNRQRGGLVENVTMEDITMAHINSDALLFDMYYRGQTPTLEFFEGNSKGDTLCVEPNDSTPCFRGIHFDRIQCTDVGRTFYFDGLRESPVQDITIRNLTTDARHPSLFSECHDVKLDEVQFLPGSCDTIYLFHTQDVDIPSQVPFTLFEL